MNSAMDMLVFHYSACECESGGRVIHIYNYIYIHGPEPYGLVVALSRWRGPGASGKRYTADVLRCTMSCDVLARVR